MGVPENQIEIIIFVAWKNLFVSTVIIKGHASKLREQEKQTSPLNFSVTSHDSILSLGLNTVESLSPLPPVKTLLDEMLEPKDKQMSPLAWVSPFSPKYTGSRIHRSKQMSQEDNNQIVPVVQILQEDNNKVVLVNQLPLMSQVPKSTLPLSLPPKGKKKRGPLKAKCLSCQVRNHTLTQCLNSLIQCDHPGCRIYLWPRHWAMLDLRIG